tara:strand:+ start:7981 stop:8874 length:894 start_codon:yes stop_codon:yes gene_type:complete
VPGYDWVFGREVSLMKGFEPGLPMPIADTTVPVYRILGRNPSAMTGPGTNSYLIGDNSLCLLDPGPIDAAQLDSFMGAIGERRLQYILITHTHGDHSPAASPIQEATGAELVGLPAPAVAGHDKSFRPSRSWQHGDILQCGEYRIRLIHTPGHVSNHFCFLLEQEQLLFTGDHVLQGTTSVILPPDGDMGHYLDSLRFLQTLDLRYFAPGHGDIMDQPQQELEALIAHRLKREQKIIDRLAQLGRSSMETLVRSVYDDVAEHLIPWAKKTLLAHLIKLEREAVVVSENGHWQLRNDT